MIADYLLMWRCLLTFYTRLNQWRDGEPNEEGLLHGMASVLEIIEKGDNREGSNRDAVAHELYGASELPE